MVLKLVESYAHAMVSVLLPYLQWQFTKSLGPQAGPLIARWFKPTACAQAADASWDPCKEWIKNSSDRVLEQIGSDTDDPYWAADTAPQGNVLQLMRNCWTTLFSWWKWLQAKRKGSKIGYEIITLEGYEGWLRGYNLWCYNGGMHLRILWFPDWWNKFL